MDTKPGLDQAKITLSTLERYFPNMFHFVDQSVQLFMEHFCKGYTAQWRCMETNGTVILVPTFKDYYVVDIPNKLKTYDLPKETVGIMATMYALYVQAKQSHSSLDQFEVHLARLKEHTFALPDRTLIINVMQLIVGEDIRLNRKYIKLCLADDAEIKRIQDIQPDSYHYELTENRGSRWVHSYRHNFLPDSYLTIPASEHWEPKEFDIEWTVD